MKRLLIVLLLVLLINMFTSALPFAVAVIPPSRPADSESPKPTEEPKTKPAFNYQAIVADPEAHYGYLDYMVGTVKQYTEYDHIFDFYDHSYGLLMCVDDVLMQTVVIYSGYNEGEDHPIVGDKIWVHGHFVDLEDRKGILGTIKVPYYISNNVQIFPREK